MASRAVNVFVSSLLLGLSVTSFARIGETMDKAVKRYGPVVHHDTIQGEELYAFKKHGYDIVAHFHEGKIDNIMYGKESREKLSKTEVNTFLEANNGGRPMKDLGGDFWEAKNGTYATLTKLGGIWHLDIKGPAYDKRNIDAYAAEEKAAQQAEKVRKEKANLKGF